jgi:ribonuclease PH
MLSSIHANTKEHHLDNAAGIRLDGRRPDQLRPARITPNFQAFPAGSVLIECGGTRVVCAASIEDRVPPFLLGSNKGWVTAEYSMLPSSTPTRTQREGPGSKPQGRSMEIQRLIGRSLRAIVDLSAIPERTITLDCDVIEADGGTRTASITGAVVALGLAIRKGQATGLLPKSRKPAMRELLAAVSVGIVDGVPMLDLNYAEDSHAQTDCNVVMTESGGLVELQATAERAAFSRAELETLLGLAQSGIGELIALQREILAG